jgi:hypothetical protein
MTILQHLPDVITAIGGLGVAAFGLVDASKAFFGGVNHLGFKDIRDRINSLVPDQSQNAMKRSDVLESLRRNWFNGTPLDSQKAIAKSLIKLNFNPETAPKMAAVTTLDAATLRDVATNVASGTALTTGQNDVYARFDLILTALLDATYQRAEQKYVSGTRAWAMVAAVLLAVAGACILSDVAPWTLERSQFWEAFVVGLLATPLAPIAKDLSSALAAAVNTLQIVKK